MAPYSAQRFRVGTALPALSSSSGSKSPFEAMELLDLMAVELVAHLVNFLVADPVLASDGAPRTAGTGRECRRRVFLR